MKKEIQNLSDENSLLKSLIEQIEKLNFRELVLKENSSNEKLKVLRKNYIVVVIDELIKVSIKNNWKLAKRDGNVYIYNGSYWLKVQKELFENFLGKVSVKMGVDEFEAKYHQFQKDLYLQFLSQSFLEISDIENQVLINVQNGTLSITGKKNILREFKNEDFLTYQLNFSFDEKAQCPLFQNFLDDVLPDKTKQLVIAEYFGSIFIKSDILKLEKMLILFGEGANGKSVIFEIFNALIGETNISNFSLENLTDRNGYYRAMIGQKLVNYASEISGRINPAILKQLASNEPIDARLPFGEPLTIKNYAKLIFNCNVLPQTDENTNAFFRRFLIIKFDKVIDEKMQDKELAFKIISSELSGVFNWILQGLERLLLQKNFTYSQAVERALYSYKTSSDSVLLFLSENSAKKSIKSYLQIQNLFDSYRLFCQDWNCRYSNKSQFIAKLKTLGYEIKRMSSGFVIYIEINN